MRDSAAVEHRDTLTCDDFTRVVNLSEVKALLIDIILHRELAQTPPSADEEKRCQDAGMKPTFVNYCSFWFTAN